MMNGKFFSIVAVMGLNFTLVQSVVPPAKVQEPIELPSNFQYPNGIARASDGTVYVGSVTSGRILRIDPKGKSETFFSGSEEIIAANSLRLDERRGILWGASSDFLGVPAANGQIIRRPHRIFAIDTRTSKVLRSILMPDGGFGNDLALAPDGGVYLTDSWRPRIYYLPLGARELQIWAEDARFSSNEIGLAGIARRADGAIFVGMFSRGELLAAIPQPGGSIKIQSIPLPRKLENPDGMQFALDGSLLVIEGAIASGDGRLVSIDVSSLHTDETESIQILAAGMESPVNLTVAESEVWVSEARIRHRLLPGQEKNIPERFFVRHFTLK